MESIQDQAEYLLQLMPLLRKGIETRIARPKPAFGRELTFGQMQILDLLFQHGPMPVSQIARSSRAALSTTTESLNRLEKSGIAERTRDLQDRRVVTIRLTGAGKRMVERWHAHARNVTVELLESLGQAEQKKIIHVFRVLETILIKKSRGSSPAGVRERKRP